MLNIDYKDSRSIYEQIVAGIKELIVNNVYCQNQQLPSVRELSISLTVNPNTVQKAYKQLESDGYIYSVKGKGCFISPPSEIKDDSKINELYENLISTVKELKYLDVEKDSIFTIINNIYKED